LLVLGLPTGAGHAEGLGEGRLCQRGTRPPDDSGFGPFYDGLTHLLVTPEDLLPVIALALLAGLRGPSFGRAVLFALPTACMAGTLTGLSFHSRVTVPAVMAVVTFALGALTFPH
jgi:hypothetical protein